MTAAAKKTDVTVGFLAAGDIIEHLALRYPAPQWAFFEQVRNATGYGAVTRTADALAFGLWPSRGLHLHGFEVKCSRGDWLRELRAPEKADEIAGYCDFWWIAAPAGCVKLDELPQPWGLLEVSEKGRLAQKKGAEALSPAPLDRAFIAAVFRKSTESMVPRSAVDGRVASLVEQRVAALSRTAEHEAREFKAKLDALVADVRTFQEASGINIRDSWPNTPKDVGEAVRRILDGPKALARSDEQLRRMQRGLRRVQEEIDRLVAEREGAAAEVSS